jgi:hypothetical protein
LYQNRTQFSSFYPSADQISQTLSLLPIEAESFVVSLLIHGPTKMGDEIFRNPRKSQAQF